MRRYFCAIVAVLALFLSHTLAEAETKTFDSPKLGDNRLDWCVNWGTGCGEEAATAWCKTVGFDKAVDAQQAPDIGASLPTKLIATGEVCDQSYCDGFTSITCATAEAPTPPQPAPETPAVTEGQTTEEPSPPPVEEDAAPENATQEEFAPPKYKGARLNWCFSGKTGCGKKAAEAFCGEQGYSGATSFKYVSAVKSTIQIGTGKTTEKGANSFSRITCVK
jgi:hypothetical protein